MSVISKNDERGNLAGNVPVMKAKYVKKMKMDGKLGSSAWTTAQEYPFELAKSVCERSLTLHEKGGVKLLWNEENLYVGVKMSELFYELTDLLRRKLNSKTAVLADHIDGLTYLPLKEAFNHSTYEMNFVKRQ